ncbi:MULTISPECIES: hypothetical protein [Pseudomonas syringae group]|nr:MULTISPECIES: hypothetical protein [Pseudomonas syringae group]KPB98057.1 Unknown protein sequence [Pseudomonas syringae pv. maculicola]MBM0212083.1 hypothetical protein [Pseudomonas syringae pv. maculicola]
MKTIQKKAVAEDLRKIGSTAIAAALIAAHTVNNYHRHCKNARPTPI